MKRADKKFLLENVVSALDDPLPPEKMDRKSVEKILETCRFKNVTEWKEKCRPSYNHSLSMPWHREVVEKHFSSSLRRSWDLNKALEAARSCSSRKEFVKKHRGALKWLVSNGKEGLLREIFELRERWSKKSALERASLCSSRSEFSKKWPGAHDFLRRNGALSDADPLFAGKRGKLKIDWEIYRD